MRMVIIAKTNKDAEMDFEHARDFTPFHDDAAQPMTGWDSARPVAMLDSHALLRGGREVLIRHAGQTYRLRHTRNDKLILTK